MAMDAYIIPGPILDALHLDVDASIAEVVAAIGKLRGDTSAADALAGGTYPRASWSGDLIDLELEHPIASGAESIGRLSFRRACVGDLIAMESIPASSPIARSIAVVAKLTRRSPKEIEKLSIPDLDRATDIVDFFTRGSR